MKIKPAKKAQDIVINDLRQDGLKKVISRKQNKNGEDIKQ